MVRYYDVMPDQKTQDMIAARGDTIVLTGSMQSVDSHPTASIDPLATSTYYQSPGSGVESYGPEGLGGAAFDPASAVALNALMDQYRAAVSAGEVGASHAILDQVNAWRRSTKQPDYVPYMTDAEILSRKTGIVTQQYDAVGNAIVGSAPLPSTTTPVSATTPYATTAVVTAPESSGGSTPVATSTIDPPAGGGGTSSTGAADPTRFSVFDLIRQAAGGVTLLSADQWGYYWRQVTGVAVAPDPLNYGFDSQSRSTPVTLDYWWAKFNANGQGDAGQTPPGVAEPGAGGGGGGTGQVVTQAKVPGLVWIAAGALLLWKLLD